MKSRNPFLNQVVIFTPLVRDIMAMSYCRNPFLNQVVIF